VKDLFGYSSDLSHPLLRSITHLDIRDMGGEFDFARVFPLIPTLPALTYFALRFEVPRDNVLSLLAQCPPLKFFFFGLAIVLLATGWSSTRRSATCVL
jgi:hypothetical protein